MEKDANQFQTTVQKKIRWLATAVVQRPELDTNRSVDSDSLPTTRYRTCGLSDKKLNLSNTQICIGEYP